MSMQLVTPLTNLQLAIQSALSPIVTAAALNSTLTMTAQTITWLQDVPVHPSKSNPEIQYCR